MESLTEVICQIPFSSSLLHHLINHGNVKNRAVILFYTRFVEYEHRRKPLAFQYYLSIYSKV